LPKEDLARLLSLPVPPLPWPPPRMLPFLSMSTMLPDVDAQAAELDTATAAHAPTAVLDMGPAVSAVTALLHHIPLAVLAGAALLPTNLRADAHAACK
jgi:hypothetical protein